MAASGTSVTVLTPNGRRQAVKVSANTLLLQVLEDVCRKHGFDPDEHGLKFQRTVIDLTVPWRYANLPNNAKLEMVTSTRKQAVADSQVRIALQMEDGSRLQDSFPCGQSLWDLLSHFPQIRASELCESGSTPACVYMRHEVSGEDALKKASLKSLGLTGGNAIVRFLIKKNKPPGEQEGRGATDTAAILTTPVAKEPARCPSHQPDPAPSHPQRSTKEPVANTNFQRPRETLPAPASAPKALPVKQEVVSNSKDAAQPSAPPAQGDAHNKDGERAGPSGLGSPLPPLSSPSFAPPSTPFIPFTGGGQRLGGPGGAGVGRPPSSFPSLPAFTGHSPKAKKAKSSCSSTKCQIPANLPDEDVDLLGKFSSKEPLERDPLIYHLDLMSHKSADQADLPDEFFEVTVDDVRKRFAQLKSERRTLEEAPLMTKSLRESQLKDKMDRYPKVVLRVQFPDRHVLQGFFRPLETVGTVMQFVKSHLENPHLSFYLFITPPKTILDDPSATLFQADLFPGALVYFGSDDAADFYIKRELLESSVSALQANESIASCMIRSPTTSYASADSEEPMPASERTTDASGSERDEEATSANDPVAKASKSDAGKVPKWFKLPGKK